MSNKRQKLSHKHINISLNCNFQKPEELTVDCGTNTDVNVNMHEIQDINIANNLILSLLNDKVEQQKIIDELVELYNLFKSELQQLQSI